MCNTPPHRPHNGTVQEVAVGRIELVLVVEGISVVTGVVVVVVVVMLFSVSVELADASEVVVFEAVVFLVLVVFEVVVFFVLVVFEVVDFLVLVVLVI